MFDSVRCTRLLSQRIKNITKSFIASAQEDIWTKVNAECQLGNLCVTVRKKREGEREQERQGEREGERAGEGGRKSDGDYEKGIERKKETVKDSKEREKRDRERER